MCRIMNGSGKLVPLATLEEFLTQILGVLEVRARLCVIKLLHLTNISDSFIRSAYSKFGDFDRVKADVPFSCVRSR